MGDHPSHHHHTASQDARVGRGVPWPTRSILQWHQEVRAKNSPKIRGKIRPTNTGHSSLPSNDSHSSLLHKGESNTASITFFVTTNRSFNLTAAVGRGKAVQAIDVHRELKICVVTFWVISQIFNFLGESRGCADFRDPTAVFRFKQRGRRGFCLVRL